MSPDVTNTQLEQLDPSVILVSSNTRYGLLESAVERMMEDIVNSGGVHTPVEVELLDKPEKGKTHRLTVGHIRHEAVTRLNNQSGAGLTLPAVVKPTGDTVARMRRQLSENVIRESLSPMDRAVSIRQLLDAGVSKMEIRKIFSKPSGPKNTLQPASNSHINMMLSFLDLPKTAQEKLHDGRLTVRSAYELTKVEPSRRAEIMAKAEAMRLREIEREQKEEERLLKAEAAEQAEHDKAQAEARALEEAAALIQSRKEQALQAKQALLEAEKQASTKALKDAPKKEQKKIAERLGAAKVNARVAEKNIEQAQKDLEKLKAKVKAKQEQAKAEPVAPKPAKAAPAGRGRSASVTVEHVKAAAAGSEHVALNAKQMRQAIEDMRIPAYPIMSKVGDTILDCFNGVITDTTMRRQLCVVLGEENAAEPKKTALKQKKTA